MSFQSFITQQVAALTERLNAIANNAKKIIELPWQSVLRPESEIHVSDAGTSFKIKIQQIFDWFYSIRQNQLLSANISVLVNEVKVASGAQWIIGNVNYSTISDTSFTIEYAEDGYTRNDILVADKNNHIIRVIGPETVGISPTPPTPIDTVLVTIINITDATIGNTPPIVGGDYEKVINKQNSLAVDGSGTKYPTVDAVNAGLAAIVVPDATTVVKGIVKLAGDLGGTADAPTTPTALHLTGNENFKGQKSFTNSDSGQALFSGVQNRTSGTLVTFQTGSNISGGTLLSINSTGGDSSTNTCKLLVLDTGVSSLGMPFTVSKSGVVKATIDKEGNIITTGNVSGANPTTANHLVTKSYADGLVVGLLDDRGSYNASTNVFPTTGGSGTSGAVLKGDLWYVSVAGTLGGKAVSVGDSFRALTDAPGQTAGNWSVLSSNLAYVPANDANVVHKTGTETITGSKSFDTTSGSTASLNATVSGTGTAAATINALNSGVGLIVSGFNSFNRNIATFSNYGTLTSASIITIRNESGSVNSDFLNCSNPTIGTVSRINKTGDITANSFIKIGGLATEYLKADGSVTTLTNPITGTGTPNFLPRFTGTGAIGNSQVFDNGTNVGIGTTNPLDKFQVNLATNKNVFIRLGGNNLPSIGFLNDAGNSYVAGEINFNNSLMLTGGNVLIGTATDNGVDKLQVNGTISATGISAPSLGATNLDTVFDSMPNNSTSTFLANNGGATSNAPTSNLCSVNVYKASASYGTMLAIDLSSNKLYTRSSHGSGWAAWVEK
ncbi:pyocin knob domain-containing protein [Flavobacterium piscisymbiosum]|uniref:Pyocin knob domain-containing protein n=1 Tax=Flavobacterium piscisymbiosum TaxID=2893753 RepID=A0ABS8MN38_9FLAO|nr:pyocin knob domain-containing protein [Flavobacterium sp. F-30]MCC9066277.1 pyocin knob domain-containing protein [Flavobacterium sp. F-30]